MLPAANRLRSTADFTAVTRRGRRASSGCLVAYLLAPEGTLTERMLSDKTEPTKIGLIVGRGVGGSVVRHRVARRLRAQLAARVHLLPAGSRVVIRALPTTATVVTDQLAADLNGALRRLSGGPRR